MKSKRISIIITSVCIVACLCAALLYRKYGVQYSTAALLTPNADDVVYYQPYRLYDDNGETNIIADITFEKLLEQSNLVVSGHMLDTTPVFQGWLTKFAVDRVFSGNCGNVISILECAGMNYNKDENEAYDNFFYTYDGYVLMQPDQEYILLLNKYNDAYTVTAQGFGKYPAFDLPSVHELGPDEQLKYSEYIMCDFICEDAQIAEQYTINAKEAVSFLSQ